MRKAEGVFRIMPAAKADTFPFPQPLYFTRRQAALVLGVNVQTIDKLLRNSKLHAFGIPGTRRLLLSREEVLALVRPR